jgi:hypothetical protein
MTPDAFSSWLARDGWPLDGQTYADTDPEAWLWR